MKFSWKQFKELDDFYIDDFPLDYNDEKTMFLLFNQLPNDIQGTVIQWGFGDTVARDNIFEHVIDRFFNVTVEEYYKEELYNSGGTFIKIDIWRKAGLLKDCPECGKPMFRIKKSNQWSQEPDYECDGCGFLGIHGGDDVYKWEIPF